MLSKCNKYHEISFSYFLKKVALRFALLPSDGEPTARTKQPLPHNRYTTNLDLFCHNAYGTEVEILNF